MKDIHVTSTKYTYLIHHFNHNAEPSLRCYKMNCVFLIYGTVHLQALPAEALLYPHLYSSAPSTSANVGAVAPSPQKMLQSWAANACLLTEEDDQLVMPISER